MNVGRILQQKYGAILTTSQSEIGPVRFFVFIGVEWDQRANSEDSG
jgi:hypothetical protein